MRLVPKKKIRRIKPSSYKSVYDNSTNWYEREINGAPKEKIRKKRVYKKQKESIPETRISASLNKYKIEFEQEKSIEGCINPKTKQPLRFDFYLPKYNTVIEYDGQQHYKSIKIDGVHTNLKSQMFRDGIKNKFCKENSIKLIRLNKDNFKKLESILAKLVLELK